MSKLLLSLFLLPICGFGFSLSNLNILKYHSFPQGACDEDRGWYTLRSWTAMAEIKLEPGEQGNYVFEYKESLSETRWKELNNNPNIAFPPYDSFHGVFSLTNSTGSNKTFNISFPAPPLDIMFFRLKRY